MISTETDFSWFTESLNILVSSSCKEFLVICRILNAKQLCIVIQQELFHITLGYQDLYDIYRIEIVYRHQFYSTTTRAEYDSESNQKSSHTEVPLHFILWNCETKGKRPTLFHVPYFWHGSLMPLILTWALILFYWERKAPILSYFKSGD